MIRDGVSAVLRGSFVKMPTLKHRKKWIGIAAVLLVVTPALAQFLATMINDQTCLPIQYTRDVKRLTPVPSLQLVRS
jgi:hypothetical protein